ncbi:flagellar M-ring protein FliF [Jatrophihabitans sp. GAS493]|uniref:flagellar basal-body MS-ring/collar protein FliF n=1 Tax=Jatrophihabitans sp. GAS493 TaxID=1907575 RepID=UPI000BB79509|nr:flagellar basal-body MS-ring/collar protein FliF [Jatrophihabitans sp. GAS493]SOD71339.1 flagellar M-ring protein FliF [Jatrophihabitans sp. GAS493]
MKDQLLGFLQRVWNGFLAFSPGQKAVSIVALLAVTIGGYVFTQWAAKPTYSPLFTNLSATDASAIIDKLNTNKVPYQLAAGGTEIDVPQANLYAQRLAISAAGLPSSGSSGYSLLDKEGVTTSDFKQQVDYQRAVEGELSMTIKSIQGVNAAAVHLAIPQQDVFNDGTVKTTASVLLTTAPGTTLNSGQVQSVVNLVANSVPGLATADVTVSDSTGKVLSAGDGTDSSTSADTQTAATKDYNSRLSSSLQTMLDQLVGAGHSSVIANAQLNFDKTDSSSKTYVYTPGTPPTSESTTNEAYTGTGNAGGGILGAGGTSAAQQSAVSVAGTSASSATANGAYSKTSDTKDNAVGTVTTNTVAAPGAVSKLNVAVVLDSSVPNVNKTAITNLITSATGLNPARGDQLAIEAMPFDTSAAKQAAQASATADAAAKAAAKKAQFNSMLRTGGLVVLVLAVIIGTLIAGRRRRKAAERAALEEPDEMDDLIHQLQYETPQEVIVEPSPSLTQASAGQEELANQRRVLVSLAENQPQDVARVMRSWLSSNN